MVPVLAGTFLPQFLFGPSTVRYCRLLKVKLTYLGLWFPYPYVKLKQSSNPFALQRKTTIQHFYRLWLCIVLATTNKK